MMNLRIDLTIEGKDISLVNIGTDGDGLNFKVGDKIPYFIYYLVRRE